jgi:hypothetical protein
VVSPFVYKGILHQTVEAARWKRQNPWLRPLVVHTRVHHYLTYLNNRQINQLNDQNKISGCYYKAKT